MIDMYARVMREMHSHGVYIIYIPSVFVLSGFVSPCLRLYMDVTLDLITNSGYTGVHVCLSLR